MAKPIDDVIKACKICVAWANNRPSHADCPYFNEEKCEDVLQADILYYLGQVKETVQPKLPGLESK